MNGQTFTLPRVDDPESRMPSIARISRFLMGLSTSRPWRITVTEARPKRSLPQRATLRHTRLRCRTSTMRSRSDMCFEFLRPWLQQHKACRMCLATKPATDFYPQKRGKFGVMGKCKECWRQYMKAYYSRKKAA